MTPKNPLVTVSLTCIALLPSFTTSNSIMFSMPFSWWWPFMRPAPFPPLPLSPIAFLPFFPPWDKYWKKRQRSGLKTTKRTHTN